MTPALDALLKEVEALDREATPGPWVANIAESEVSSAGWNEAAEAEGLPKMPRFRTEVELFCETAKGRGNVFPNPFMGLPYAGNARATAHYRTAAPRLAAMLRVAVEALDGMPDADTLWDVLNVRAAALARIEAMAKGEA